ncbi:MAG: mechanosensitive ion channel family protein [Bdellovibrionales bacterium]
MSRWKIISVFYNRPMQFLLEIWDRQIAGNPVSAWVQAAAALILVTLGLRLVQSLGFHRLKTLLSRHRLAWPEHLLSGLEQTKFYVLVLLGLGAALPFLDIPPNARKFIDGIVIVGFFVQGGIWLSAVYMSWYKDYRTKHLKKNASTVTTLDATRVLVRFVIWICIALLILNNLGFNISALIAGLGVGGVAIALAVQKILGDVLASLAIITDQPFAVGDFLIIGDFLGSVEYIGLNTTRLRSLTGEQIVFSNSDLLSARIRNYGRMYERRLDVVLGFEYQTPQDKLEIIPNIIKETILAQDKVRFDRAHFKAFGASTLDFEYVYFVQSPDFNIYMDIQQAINLALRKRFDAEGINLAFPTQTLVMQRPPRPQAGPSGQAA